MPLNPEQLLKAVKLDGKTFETEEEFVAEFSKQYAPVDAPISEEKKQKVIGGLLGTLETTLKRETKEFGVEYEIDKKKPFQDTLAEVLGVIREAKNTEFEALKASAGTGSTEAVAKLTSEVDKWKNKFNDEKALREQGVTQWQAKEQEYEGKIKNTKKEYIFTKEKEKYTKFKTGITELEKIGFDQVFNSKYKNDTDENDGLIITDLSGKQIPDPKVAGRFLSFAEVLEMEGKAQNVWELNPHTAKNSQPQPTRTQPIVQTPDNGHPTRKIAQPINAKV
jgi:hypothetical protein